MKSLLDIQQDVRSLEKSVQEVANLIKGINLDMEEFRTANQNTDVDFSKIETLAKNISFGKHPIRKLSDGRACQIYLEMLLNIVRLDLEEEVSFNRLVFIQWLQTEAEIDWTLEDLYKDCYKIKSTSYHDLLDVIPKKYREYFIVDAVIVANLGGNAITDIYEYIADLAAVLGIDKERLRALSFVAGTALCQSTGHMKKKEIAEFLMSAKSFKHYIKTDILESGFKSIRQVIVELSDDEAQDFKWKVQQGKEVKKGDIVATYSRALRQRGFSWMTNFITEEVKAPSEGTIFQFRDNGINYGVLAHEVDDKNSIKAWVKARR